MNMNYTADTDFRGPETTTLMELVSVVSDLTENEAETIQVVRHMLLSNHFSFAARTMQLD